MLEGAKLSLRRFRPLVLLELQDPSLAPSARACRRWCRFLRALTTGSSAIQPRAAGSAQTILPGMVSRITPTTRTSSQFRENGKAAYWLNAARWSAGGRASAMGWSSSPQLDSFSTMGREPVLIPQATQRLSLRSSPTSSSHPSLVDNAHVLGVALGSPPRTLRMLHVVYDARRRQLKTSCGNRLPDVGKSCRGARKDDPFRITSKAFPIFFASSVKSPRVHM